MRLLKAIMKISMQLNNEYGSIVLFLCKIVWGSKNIVMSRQNEQFFRMTIIFVVVFLEGFWKLLGQI